MDMQLDHGCIIMPDIVDIMAMDNWWTIVQDKQLKHKAVQD